MHQAGLVRDGRRPVPQVLQRPPPGGHDQHPQPPLHRPGVLQGRLFRRERESWSVLQRTQGCRDDQHSQEVGGEAGPSYSIVHVPSLSGRLLNCRLDVPDTYCY